MSNNDKLTEVLYVKIPASLKKLIKKQSIDLNIDLKDYTILSLEHYASHIMSGEIGGELDV